MGKRILLVGDNPDCTEIMRYILEDEGFTVLSTQSASILFNYTTNFDLVVLDEFSLGRKGGEVCKQLKSDAHTSGIPIMLTSAGMDVKSLAILCKADVYLSKPFDIDLFTHLIHKAVHDQ